MAMTSRQRLQTVLAGKIPDCVPCAPDFSNMIPARRTGKPFWQLYLYNDPPIWEAYIDAAKYFNIDSLMDGYFPLRLDDYNQPPWEHFIVRREPDRLITMESYVDNGKRIWKDTCCVSYIYDPPKGGVPLSMFNLPSVPEYYEPLEGAKPVDLGPSGFAKVKAMLGEQGMMGVFAASTCALYSEEMVYEYYDHPELHEKWAQDRVEAAERRFNLIMKMPVKPDFLCVGGSGSLIFQTLDILREQALPAVKRVIELATAAGLPTHIHSCGPEAELVKLMAEETTLTVIDPLEIPPMGNCNLAELKKLYGDRIVLKGNLHTTDVMLRGSRQDVVDAAKKCIDDAAAGGRFILSTGDQCGRDTPDENLLAMVETARTYGKY